jgi:hypothetical protein
MKKRLVFVLLLIIVLAANAQDYDYLQVVVANGETFVNLRAKPKSLGYTLNSNAIKTISWQNFLEMEPGVTRPGGFFLCQELNHWERNSDDLQRINLYRIANSRQFKKLAGEASFCLFADSLRDLERDKFIMFWISLTRNIVKHQSHGSKFNFPQESQRLALTGKLIWDLLPKSWAVEDIYVYPLGDASGLWVNLLVDAGNNTMTKIILFPELYYGKEKFSYDLVNKLSKDLKNFAVYK